MSAGTLGVLGLGLYLVVLGGLAAVAHRARRDLSPADHFLAGRQLGVFVLFLTLYATAFSGNSLVGYPAEAYRRGYAWIMATAFMLAIAVVSQMLVPRLRPLAVTHAFVTPGDWIRHRFRGERGCVAATVVVGVVMTVALANFLLAQLVAMGHVASQVSGGLLPYWAGVVGLAAVVLGYETLGGMRAVAWTDVLQGLLMFVGLGAMLWWVLGEAGGLAAVTRAVAATRPSAVMVPDRQACLNWASTIVLVGVGASVYPQAIQRVYAARSGQTLGRALALLTFMPLVTIVVVTLVGVSAIPRFAHLGAIEADAVLPRLLAAWAASGPFGAVSAMLVFVAALAAIMSTADSVLLSLGSVVAGDVLGRSGDDPRTTRLGKQIAATILVGMTSLALVPRLTLWRLTELKMELLVQCAPVFLLGLHVSRLRALPVLIGVVVGTLIASAGVLTGVARIQGIHVGVLGLVANVAIAVVGSGRRS